MARFYGIALEPTLFGEVSLMRQWGRIGKTGRATMETFSKIGEAVAARDKLEQVKRRKGYRGQV
jgi:predicted DNA-binding WGR domain protein